jgi:multidrug transporter EmrE-like cation transporter
VLGAGAQIFFKLAGNGLAGLSAAHVLSNPLVLLGNLPLLAGYVLYGFNTIMMVLALRKGELSVLYPIISLTYVWVLILSGFLFKESINTWKIAGVMAIVAGVGVMGGGGGRR